MTNSEFSDFIVKLQAMGAGPNPTQEEQLRYAATHGPYDDHCTLCGKERCACWRLVNQPEPTLIPHSVMVSQIAAAVAAEREACAKIVDGIIEAIHDEYGGRNYDPELYVRAAASRIRARKDSE